MSGLNDDRRRDRKAFGQAGHFEAHVAVEAVRAVDLKRHARAAAESDGRIAATGNRRREIGMRLALGAGQWRVVTLVALENLILAFAGAALGTGIAVWGTTALRAVPFMFLSSTMGREGEEQEGMDLGADRFILRPIEPQALLDEIASILDR